jgi:hypothetical protein
MFRKSLAFGLLAAGLMIAPTAAFAGTHGNQSQNNQQNTEQNGSATNGSTNAQESNSINVQRQISNIRSRTHVPYRIGGYPHSNHASQAQNSVQGTSQNGAADNDSTNAQTSTTTNHQSQGTGLRSRFH